MDREQDRKIMVVGHKNPDTDSICSAIAYAHFKNKTTNRTYVPRRAGEINAETKFVLGHFNVPVPEYIDDVGTQVSDMDIRMTPAVGKETTIRRAWDTMNQNEAVTQPVTEDGKVIGLITKGDIARTLMDTRDNHFLSKARPRYKDIADAISGSVAVGDPDSRFESGKVLIGAAGVAAIQEVVEQGDLVILVDRSENQKAALESGAGCLILCLGARADEAVRRLAENKNAVIIETELDTYTVSREVNMSVPLESFMLTEDIESFKMDDFTDRVRAVMARTRHRAFPVLDAEDNYVGTVSRRNLLAIKKKEVVLVDHNEETQAVDNIAEAEILEIIDHHRIGTVQTLQPIYFINQPVGCTATILYQLYLDKNVEIPPIMAGLMCAAIISDTLMFRSPTCTIQDKMAAGALALIAEIDIEDFATKMFDAGSALTDKSPEEVFYQDYKKFSFGGKEFGVGQISSMSEEELKQLKDKLTPILKSECGKNGTTMVFYLLTNIKKSSSEIIYAGEFAEDLIVTAFKEAVPLRDGIPIQGDEAHVDFGEADSYELPGVLSRKKQLIPAFMRIL